MLLEKNRVKSIGKVVEELVSREVEVEVVNIVKGLAGKAEQTAEGGIDSLWLEEQQSLLDSFYFNKVGLEGYINAYGGEGYTFLKVIEFYSYKYIENYRVVEASPLIVAEVFLDSATGLIFNRVRVVDKGGDKYNLEESSTPFIIVVDDIYTELKLSQIRAEVEKLEKSRSRVVEGWREALDSYGVGQLRVRELRRERRLEAAEELERRVDENYKLAAEVYVRGEGRLASSLIEAYATQLELVKRLG